MSKPKNTFDQVKSIWLGSSNVYKVNCHCRSNTTASLLRGAKMDTFIKQFSKMATKPLSLSCLLCSQFTNQTGHVPQEGVCMNEACFTTPKRPSVKLGWVDVKHYYTLNVTDVLHRPFSKHNKLTQFSDSLCGEQFCNKPLLLFNLAVRWSHRHYLGTTSHSLNLSAS